MFVGDRPLGKPLWLKISSKALTFHGLFYSAWIPFTKVVPLTKHNQFFYKLFQGITTEEDKKLAATGDYNFDHPDAFDWELVSKSA